MILLSLLVGIGVGLGLCVVNLAIIELMFRG